MAPLPDLLQLVAKLNALILELDNLAPNSSIDIERARADVTAALDDAALAGDPILIPFLLNHLFNRDAAVRESVERCVSVLTRRMPPDKLPGFEQQLRDNYVAMWTWHRLGIEQVRAHEWPIELWALFTMHPCGYIREAAVTQIATHSDASLSVPILLVRLNDWVPQVRDAASAAVQRLIQTAPVTDWVPSIGLLGTLRGRSRADHTLIERQIAAVFLRPDNREHFIAAIRSPDRKTSRWAVRVALRVPEAERGGFLELAIESSDLLNRSRAAEEIRRWKTCPNRDELLRRMRRDPYMPVRRQALYAALETPLPERIAHLKRALLDRHVSMRHAARVYLAELSAQEGLAFDPRQFYLSIIGDPSTPDHARALAGLGDAGTPEDVRHLHTFVTTGYPDASAAAAVRAIGLLGRLQNLSSFQQWLADPRPAVSNQACIALIAAGTATDRGAVRQVLTTSPYAHARLNATRVLLSADRFDALADAIEHAGTTDPAVARMCDAFIGKLIERPPLYAPGGAQAATIQATLRRCTLPAAQQSRVRRALGLPTEGDCGKSADCA